MKSTRTLLMVVAAVTVSGVETFSFCPSSDSTDVMVESTQMVGSVLSTLLQDKCYAILFSDGSTSHNTIFKMDKLRSAWGTGVFEIDVQSQHANLTKTYISWVVGVAHQMRRISWCVVVVVVSDDLAFLTAFADWSLKGRLLVWSTRLLVVTRLPREVLEALLASHWTFSMMNTMALNINPPSETKGSSLLVHLPYSPDGAQTVKVASWTQDRGLRYLTPLTLFPEKFLNFHGATINIAVLTYEPHWTITVTGNTTTNSGIEYNMMAAICKTRNFTFRNLPTRSWAEVEDMVEDRRILLTPMVYTILPNRLKRWDYTVVYAQSGLFFIMATPVITPNWLSFYYPFSDQVWIAVLTSTFVVCIFLVKITGSIMWRSRHGRLSTGSVVLEAVGTLLGQGLYGRLSTSRSNHTLVGTWLLFGVVVGTAYRSSLIASLTLPRLPPRPETAEELVRAVDNITGEPFSIYMKEFFSVSEIPTYRAVARLLHLGFSLMDGLHAVVKTKNQAHLGTELNLRVAVSNHFTRLDGTPLLYLGKQSMFQLLWGWPITHDAPYKPAVDGVMRYLVEAGLYEQWKKEELAATARDKRIRQRVELRTLQQKGKMEKNSENTNNRSLVLTHILGPLLLLLLGLCLGGMAFFVEKFLIPRPLNP